MFPKRLFWRVFLVLVASVVLVSVFLGTILYRHLYNTTLANLKADLLKETEVLAAMAENSPEFLQHPEKIARLVHTQDRITIIRVDGVVLADNWAERVGIEALENHANRPEFRAAMAGSPIFLQRFSHTLSREMLYYAVLLKQNDKPVFVLRLSFALTTFLEQMAAIRQFLIAAAFLSILLSLPFAALLSRSITHPIESLRSGAHRIATGDLSQPVDVRGSSEFRELAADFNAMAEQLNQKIISIREQHKQTEALLSRMVEGVFAVDPKGRAVFANAAFCRMTGWKEEEIRGRSFLEITRNDQLSQFISDLIASPNMPLTEAIELKFYGPEGDKDFSVQASRIQQDGNIASVLLVFHDITRIKKVEQIRKDFVANVSHELRTPLTALKGSTEILLDGAYQDPKQSKRFLEIMDKQLRNIQNLVSDMLKLASVERTEMPLQREIVEIHQLMKETIQLLDPVARRRDQRLELDIFPEDLHLTIDERQIFDAIINLVDNAIKYSDDGDSIFVIVEKPHKGIKISIRDEGSGIPSAQLPRLFERFYRLDKSRSREMGGTGLGLAIAKHAVENHGGTISVQSELGRGSIFTIHLPESAIAKAQQPAS